MKWKDHNRWAAQLGISDEVSEEVNNLIDAINTNEGLYAEFERKKKSITRSLTDDDLSIAKGSFDAVAAMHMGEHDGSQSPKTSAKLEGRAKLKFLQSKGEEYVKAWYLHHYLDYLVEHSESSDNMISLIDGYRQEKYRPLHSQEIEKFLLANEEELASKLNN